MMDAVHWGSIAAKAPAAAAVAIAQERERLTALAYGPLTNPKSTYLLVGGKSPE